MSGNGSPQYPFDLISAFAYPHIAAGHIVWLKTGTYQVASTCSLGGASGNPITLKPLNAGARVILNNNTVLNGSYLEFRNLEFAYDGWTTRESAQAGESPNDLPNIVLSINTVAVKFINCIIHDLRQPGFWSAATNAEMNGCILFNNGWNAPDRGHGHGIYTQNTSGTKLIKDCVIFDNFGWGIHAYSGAASGLVGISLIGNTCFRNGSLSGTVRPDMLIGAESGIVQAPTIQANMTYGGSLGLQLYGAGAEDVTLTNNYMPNGKSGTYTSTTESGNYWDAAIGNQVFVRANDYDANRANVTIYNQAQADTVQVDVSSVLNAGDSYRLRNVQDFFVDWQTGTVAGDGTITVDMQASNRSVQAPVAWTAPDTTFPNFGCFVLEKTA